MRAGCTRLRFLDIERAARRALQKSPALAELEPYLLTFVDPVISPGFRLPYGGALTSDALKQ
jgi:hypothetical protein